MKALTTLMALSGRRPHVETGVLRSQVCTLLSPHRHDGQCRSTAVRIPMGLLYEHTHFMEGVALHIPLPVGLATAVQPAESGHLFWSADGEQVPPETLPPCLHCILERGVAHVRHPVHGVVLGPTGRCYEEGLLGALSAAWSRVVEHETDRADTLRRAAAWLSECLQRPFGVAPVLAAEATVEAHVLILDTETLEYLPVPIDGDPPAWGVLDTGIFQEPPSDFYWEKVEAREEALRLLREKGFPLPSLRQLAHEDLQVALQYLPRRLRPTVRHLVTENRRVQRMTLALRKGDFQMTGGLMFISQASLRRDWKNTLPEIDELVARAQTYEGIYGMRMIGPGFGGQMLVLGQRFLLEETLEILAEWFYHRTQILPETAIL